MAPVTLWFLESSRSIRIAWLLEELGLDYELKLVKREQGVAPAETKQEIGGLGIFPTLRDGDIFVYESGNITEYLCDTYDQQHKLLPPLGDVMRYKVLFWVHAAEGVWAIHATPILMIRQFQKDGDPKQTEKAASSNLIGDMDYLERELNKGNAKFLCGNTVTAADCMMHFVASFYLARLSDVSEKKYEAVERYMQACEATESFKRVIAKIGNAA